jgi:phosphoglycolate phosphatase
MIGARRERLAVGWPTPALRARNARVSDDRQPAVVSDLTGLAAVAFDFDGTLADTSGAIVATAQQTFGELGVAPLAPEEIIVRMGLPLVQVFIAAGVPEAQLAHAVTRYRARFLANASRVELFPGVLPCLQVLAAAGIPLGIASSRVRATLLPLLERLGIRSFFRDVLGEEDAVQKKPAPELVLVLAQRMQLPATRMLVVGDTTYDIEMGHAAGAHTCAVTYGSHDSVRLRSANPHHLLDSLVELHPRVWERA